MGMDPDKRLRRVQAFVIGPADRNGTYYAFNPCMQSNIAILHKYTFPTDLTGQCVVLEMNKWNRVARTVTINVDQFIIRRREGLAEIQVNNIQPAKGLGERESDYYHQFLGKVEDPQNLINRDKLCHCLAVWVTAKTIGPSIEWVITEIVEPINEAKHLDDQLEECIQNIKVLSLPVGEFN